MVNPTVTVDCIHCKVYEPSATETKDLTTALPYGGFICPRCGDECRVLLGSKHLRSVSELVMVLDILKGNEE